MTMRMINELIDVMDERRNCQGFTKNDVSIFIYYLYYVHLDFLCYYVCHAILLHYTYPATDNFKGDSPNSRII